MSADPSTPTDPRSAVEDISERLRAGRYGELACLRALAVVEKSRSSMEEYMRRRLRGDWRDGVSPERANDELRPSETQSSTTRSELENLGSARRVTGSTADFRQRLMRALNGQTEGQHHEPPNPETHGRSQPAMVRLVRSRSRQVLADPHATPMTPGGAHEATPLPQSVVWATEASIREEMRVLAAGRAVSRRLEDDAFHERISRVLRAREVPPSTTLRPQRVLRPPPTAARPQPLLHVASGNPSTTAMPHTRAAPYGQEAAPASLDQIALVAGASFELLLSIRKA